MVDAAAGAWYPGSVRAVPTSASLAKRAMSRRNSLAGTRGGILSLAYPKSGLVDRNFFLFLFHLPVWATSWDASHLVQASQGGAANHAVASCSWCVCFDRFFPQ